MLLYYRGGGINGKGLDAVFEAPGEEDAVREFFFGEKQAEKGGVSVDSPKYDGMSQSEAYLIQHEANFHAGKAFDGYYCCGDSNHKGKGSLLLVDLDEALPHGVVVQVGAKVTLVTGAGGGGSDDDSDDQEDEEQPVQAEVTQRFAAGAEQIVMMDQSAVNFSTKTRFSEGAAIKIVTSDGDLSRVIKGLTVTVPMLKDFHPNLAPKIFIPPKICIFHALAPLRRASPSHRAHGEPTLTRRVWRQARQSGRTST